MTQEKRAFVPVPIFDKVTKRNLTPTTDQIEKNEEKLYPDFIVVGCRGKYL